MQKRFVGILGSGAREHALAWRIHLELAQKNQEGVFAFYPGNDFLATLGSCFQKWEQLLSHAASFEDASVPGEKIIIIGSETYAGLADDLIGDPGWQVWGPTRAAAELEWSKSFAKDWMQRYG